MDKEEKIPRPEHIIHQVILLYKRLTMVQYKRLFGSNSAEAVKTINKMFPVSRQYLHLVNKNNSDVTDQQISRILSYTKLICDELGINLENIGDYTVYNRTTDSASEDKSSPHPDSHSEQAEDYPSVA
jgi:hypothetical protein